MKASWLDFRVIISILRPESFSLSSFYTLIGVKFKSCHSLLLVTACAWVSHHVLSVFLCLLLPPSVLFSVLYMLKKCVCHWLGFLYSSHATRHSCTHISRKYFLEPTVCHANQRGHSKWHRFLSPTFFLAEKVGSNCRQLCQHVVKFIKRYTMGIISLKCLEWDISTILDFLFPILKYLHVYSVILGERVPSLNLALAYVFSLGIKPPKYCWEAGKALKGRGQ